jgi:uncharacterized lipoprotein YmbA
MGNKIEIIKGIIILLALVFLIGCGSSEPSKFYLLKSHDCDNEESALTLPDSISLGIGPIKIPDYLRRPSIAYYNSENEIIYSQLNRWAEPIEVNLSRIFRENLSCYLSTLNLHTYPWRNPKSITHELQIEIINLEISADTSLNLKALWKLYQFGNTDPMIKKLFRKNYEISEMDYNFIAKSKSNAISDLSAEISEAILIKLNVGKDE